MLHYSDCCLINTVRHSLGIMANSASWISQNWPTLSFVKPLICAADADWGDRTDSSGCLWRKPFNHFVPAILFVLLKWIEEEDVYVSRLLQKLGNECLCATTQKYYWSKAMRYLTRSSFKIRGNVGFLPIEIFATSEWSVPLAYLSNLNNSLRNSKLFSSYQGHHFLIPDGWRHCCL